MPLRSCFPWSNASWRELGEETTSWRDFKGWLWPWLKLDG